MLCYHGEYQFLIIQYEIDLLFIGVTFVAKHKNICTLVMQIIQGHVWKIFLLAEGDFSNFRRMNEATTK